MHQIVTQEGCSHCTHGSRPHHYMLAETALFRIACDPHPLEEGHILIMPKSHIECIGTYDDELMTEFRRLYDDVFSFVKTQYGSVAVFEHGVLGQTVFHSHVHFLPYTDTLEEIIPEGVDRCTPLENVADLKELYARDKGYLFFALGDQKWTVDTALAAPRFFRDRFGSAVGHPERANWKNMSADPAKMQEVGRENKAVQNKWKAAHGA